MEATVTERVDIEPIGGVRRLSYTRRCGWVDWGHARPTAALGLKEQILSEQGADSALRGVGLALENSPAYVLTFGERMGRVWRGRFYGAPTDSATLGAYTGSVGARRVRAHQCLLWPLPLAVGLG